MALRDYRDVKHAFDAADKDNPVPKAVTESRSAFIWELVQAMKRESITVSEAESALDEFDHPQQQE